MGKTKKSKAKSADFQKTKLKVGKTLKKHNETDTTMRVGKVALLEQLKTPETQPTTHRKLNLLDLSQQCHHFNSSIRRDAAGGMKQLLISDADNFLKHLSSVFTATLPLLIDSDKSVRSSAFGLFESIFRKLPLDSLRPYCPALVAQICCGLTHIEKKVKISCLNFCEGIVAKCAPFLLSLNADILNALSTQLPGGKVAKSGIVYSQDEMLRWLNALHACISIALHANNDQDTRTDRCCVEGDLSYDFLSDDAVFGSAEDVISLEQLLDRCLPFLRNIWTETIASTDDSFSDAAFSDAQLQTFNTVASCKVSIFAALRHRGGEASLRKAVSEYFDGISQRKLREAFPLKSKHRGRETETAVVEANLKFLGVLLVINQDCKTSMDICADYFHHLRRKTSLYRNCDFVDFCMENAQILPVDKFHALWLNIFEFICSVRDPKIISRLAPCLEFLLSNGIVRTSDVDALVEVVLLLLFSDACESCSCLRLLNMGQLTTLQQRAVERLDLVLSRIRKLSASIVEPANLRTLVQDFYYLFDCRKLCKDKLKEILAFFEDADVKNDVKCHFLRILCAKFNSQLDSLDQGHVSGFGNLVLAIILSSERKGLQMRSNKREELPLKQLQDRETSLLEIQTTKSFLEHVSASAQVASSQLATSVIEKSIEIVHTACQEKSIDPLLVFRIVVTGDSMKKQLSALENQRLERLKQCLLASVCEKDAWRDVLSEYAVK